MLSGAYRNTLLDRVVYGRPAPDVLAELLDAYGCRRALVVSTRFAQRPAVAWGPASPRGSASAASASSEAHLGALAAR